MFSSLRTSSMLMVAAQWCKQCAQVSYWNQVVRIALVNNFVLHRGVQAKTLPGAGAGVETGEFSRLRDARACAEDVGPWAPQCAQPLDFHHISSSTPASLSLFRALFPSLE